MNKIVELFSKQKEIKEYISDIEKYKSIFVYNTTINHNILLTILNYYKTSQTVFYVASSLYKATQVYEAIAELIGIENVNFYAVDEVVAVEALAISSEFKYERMNTINSLVHSKKKIVVTHIQSILRPILEKETFTHNALFFKEKDIINIKEVINTLIKIGYKKTPTTLSTGDFSVRGEIIDIFPINSKFPIRIDLFDDEIEYIKTFDPTTQMSIEKIGEIEVFALNELIYPSSEDLIKKIKEDIEDSNDFSQDEEDILNYNNIERIHKYIKYITNKTYSIVDYVDEGTIIYDNYKDIFNCYTKTLEELTYYLEDKKFLRKLNLIYYLDINYLLNSKLSKIFLSEFRQSLNDIYLDKLININGLMVLDYKNNVKNFVQDVKSSKQTILITCKKDININVLEEVLSSDKITYNLISEGDIEANLKENSINIVKYDKSIAFNFINGLEVITDEHIFKKMTYKEGKYRSVYQNATPINSKEELNIGDYVVHYDYGIGKYLGIKTVELKDTINDYIMIQFNNLELYIPVDKINLIEKYQASEGSTPRLTNIGTNEWEKKKKKVQEKVASIALDLIKTEAKREKEKGFLYKCDDEIQLQFESDFEYEETLDQIKTIDDIKQDMQAGKIIDRLICGDVGYGKTEVAIRIAMKTVLNGKQVAYLAPTTILTRQHYYTFKARFEKYGVNVQLLNRLVDAKTKDKVINDLKRGVVDIVIGTHSLLSDNIVFKDLGLLIVDEEQRFGVTHKEKIKRFKDNVNVITLTATPIPRTLQMSIMGVRQLSLISTPPLNRYPVQTYVLEENDIIIKEAIYREMGRGGQVFYLHNRINDLERVYLKLRKLTPEAKIMMVHGQMDKNLLEDSIQSFIDKEYDVLLCTTIIETGIDIPNTNTLIVDMADRLGLAQMYQIRGRVGRSQRVSYAYFMYNKAKVLEDNSLKRLQAIKEFTSMGSGYKIAVRDLAIRGAGDILGKEQSGFIDSIGLDLYMKMLSDEINKLKGIENKKEDEVNYQIEVSKHVSDKYVSDDDIKIYIHKEISLIDSLEKKQEVIKSLTDRFGKLTQEIITYIDKQYMEGLFKKYKVEKVKEDDFSVLIIFSSFSNDILDTKKLFQATYHISSDFSFEYRNKKIHMKLIKRVKDKSWMYKIIHAFEAMEK